MSALRKGWHAFRNWNDRRRVRRNAIGAYLGQNYDLKAELARTGTLAMSARL